MNYNKIRELCEQRKITIPLLAQEIGLSEPGLYQMIRNKSIKVDTLEKIAKALDVTVYDFFDLPALAEDEFPFIPGDIRKLIENPLKQEIIVLKKSLELLKEEKEKLKDIIIDIQGKFIDQSSGSL